MAVSKSPDSKASVLSKQQTANEPDPDVEGATKSIEDAPNNIGESKVTDKQYEGMTNILNNIYAYRNEDGEDPSKLFHRKVNRRMVPDYYDIIKEPMAMSMIKAKLNNREYKTFEEFVRDWALISHNAQLYNSPNAQAYIDALTIKDVVAQELQKLVGDGLVSNEQTEFPFLGEIPPPDEGFVEEEEEEDEDDEDEDDEEDESDEDGRKKRKRGRQSLASKRESKAEGKEDEGETGGVRKRRGRPPRVDTPMEARIKAVMKGLRKPKNQNGELMILAFERLPDKAEEPGYFSQIKNPIALDGIKRKLKRKKYNSVDQFMRDVELMFNNAQLYNEDDSQIHQDAIALLAEAKDLAEAEKKKPDSEFTMEDGRVPLPDGILHNGEVWKVGDWVHLLNANDLSKPIVAQIYRTWQDPEGAQWVNACWYYRPEQTVHRFDRHFYENEVVKTGQYRDHPIDEVVDRCFVMFFTRYNKGRPRNFPPDKEVYVCECRYNEEKHKLNKIKTWASCLPDEVRDKDYEMDLFDAPRKLKKVPSPIKYLFKEGAQKETDDLPKPVWGAPNAPPKIGAVHCRPRDPKDSPPPEPTPTPPPQPPPQPVRQMAPHQPNGFAAERPSNINIAAANTPRHTAHSIPTPQPLQPSGTYAPGHVSHTQYQPSPSPAPLHPQMSHSNTYSSHHAQSYTPAHGQQSVGYNNTAQQQVGPRSTQGAPLQAYKAPNAVEVWHLPDAANASIPEDIREQFQRDKHGHVLFFTAPPTPPSDEKKKLKHSTSYLAWRARSIREKMLDKKRKADEQATEGAEVDRPTKKTKGAPAEPQLEITFEYIQEKAIEHINYVLIQGFINQLRADHGDEGLEHAVDVHMKYLHDVWVLKAKEQEARERATAEREAKEKESNKIIGLTRLLDYKPPNERLEWPSRH